MITSRNVVFLPNSSTVSGLLNQLKIFWWLSDIYLISDRAAGAFNRSGATCAVVIDLRLLTGFDMLVFFKCLSLIKFKFEYLVLLVFLSNRWISNHSITLKPLEKRYPGPTEGSGVPLKLARQILFSTAKFQILVSLIGNNNSFRKVLSKRVPKIVPFGFKPCNVKFWQVTFHSFEVLNKCFVSVQFRQY